MICSPRPCWSMEIAAIDNISAKVASWLKQACVIFLVWSRQHIFHQFPVEDEPKRELNRWWRLNINSYGGLDFIDWEMSIVLFVQNKCGRRRASLEWTLLSPKEVVEVGFSYICHFFLFFLFFWSRCFFVFVISYLSSFLHSWFLINLLLILEVSDEKKDNSSKVVEARSKFQNLLLNTIRFADARSKNQIPFKLSAVRLEDHNEFEFPGRSVWARKSKASTLPRPHFPTRRMRGDPNCDHHHHHLHNFWTMTRRGRWMSWMLSKGPNWDHHHHHLHNIKTRRGSWKMMR